MNSIGKIEVYRGPLLLGHGDADRTIPFSHGQKLFEAATGPKKMVVFPGGDHNSPMSYEWQVELNQFLERLPTSFELKRQLCGSLRAIQAGSLHYGKNHMHHLQSQQPK